MKVIINQDEMQAAVISFFGLPLDSEVALETNQNQSDADETHKVESVSGTVEHQVEDVKPKQRRKRKKRNHEVVQDSKETSETKEDETPQVHSSDLVKPMEESVNETNKSSESVLAGEGINLDPCTSTIEVVETTSQVEAEASNEEGRVVVETVSNQQDNGEECGNTEMVDDLSSVSEFTDPVEEVFIEEVHLDEPMFLDPEISETAEDIVEPLKLTPLF